MNDMDIFYAFITYLNRWPSQSELKAARRQRTESSLRRYVRGRGGKQRSLAPAPTWILRNYRDEMGRDVGYLTIPELARVIIKSSAQGWEASKTQAAIENTGWWRNRTNQQRQWPLLLPGERARLIQQTAVSVLETYRRFYGVDWLEKQGWTASSANIKWIAEKISKGDIDMSVWTFEARSNAELISNSPAWQAKQEEIRRQGEEGVAVENLRGQLEDTWREWVGTGVAVPGDVTKWAENIRNNRNSLQDFEDFVKKQAISLYPNKPEELPYSTWVSPAKNVLGGLLDLGVVEDDDPLLSSYVRGEIPSLADLQARARFDPRFGKSTTAVNEARNIGTSLLKKWGFA